MFIQDDWKIGGGLTINAGLRYDVFGMLNEKNGRIGNYYLPDAAAELGVKPGFYVPSNAPFFQPGFTPLSIGLYVVPGTTVDTSQISVAPYESTLRGDKNNVAPRIGLAWQPTFAPRFVIRGGWGLYYERPSAGFKVDMQRAAPFFLYQNVPAPLDMANPYPQLNVNPFQIPLDVRIVRDASGAPRWVKADGSNFPSMSPFSREEQHLHRSAGRGAVDAAVVGERAVRSQPSHAARSALRRLARTGSARQDQSRDARRSARDAGQRLHRHLRRAGPPDQPGLLRPGGVPGPQSQQRLPAAHQHRPVHLSRVPVEPARPLRDARVLHGGLHVRQVARHAVVGSLAGRTRSVAAREQLRTLGLRPPASALVGVGAVAAGCGRARRSFGAHARLAGVGPLHVAVGHAVHAFSACRRRTRSSRRSRACE